MPATPAPALPCPPVAETAQPWRRVWARVRRWALPAFGLLVLALLLSHAHRIDWAGAWRALRAYPPGLLAIVVAIAIVSHALYGSFDLIGRRHVGHRIGRWRTWAIAVTSYAFNLNLGSLVGGVAMRARLYTRAGLDEAGIAQVVGVSLATNWLGYGLLAGALFAAGVIVPPPQAPLSPGAVRALGGAMVLLVAGYVAACAWARGRSWCVRGRRLRLPSPRLALMQLVVSAANWALMGLAIHLLLGDAVGYGTALGVLMAAAVAGVVMPIPAGLGVLEAVYLALLGGSLGQGRVMGAVLAYRMLYYLVPLGTGLLLYLLLERSAGAVDQ